MPNAAKATQRAVNKKSAPTVAAPDALDLLKADHDKVKEMFERYESLTDRALASKKKLAREICLELTKHAIAE